VQCNRIEEAGFNTMDVAFSKNDAQWKDDVYQIGQYYRRHLQEAKDAEDPARLAQRDADDARKFFDCLFDTINLTTPLSILSGHLFPRNRSIVHTPENQHVPLPVVYATIRALC
jgi:hypothetical protein